MVTGELKNKIDALWDIFAAGGRCKCQYPYVQKVEYFNVQ